MIVECCMRSHHYGRHGPHAWRKRHKRRYSRPSLLPVPVGLPKVIRVYIPVTAERIIFIIMPDPSYEDKQPATIGDMTDPSESTDKRLSMGDKPLENKAKWQAVDDLDEIERMKRSGAIVGINEDRLAARSTRLAQNAIKELYVTGGAPPEIDERKRLITVYTKAYQERFQKGLDDVSEGIEEHTQEELDLREDAIQDSKKFAFSNDRDMRDLAVIRVLIQMQLGFHLEESPNYLQKIHSLVDVYQKYFNNPGEVVIWPQEPF